MGGVALVYDGVSLRRSKLGACWAVGKGDWEVLFNMVG